MLATILFDDTLWVIVSLYRVIREGIKVILRDDKSEILPYTVLIDSTLASREILNLLVLALKSDRSVIEAILYEPALYPITKQRAVTIENNFGKIFRLK